MYNLHCHSLLSDGDLLPSEIAVRYAAQGYKIIAITDHVDYSNIEQVSRDILLFCRNWPKNSGITVLPGVELTHLPVNQFKPLAKFARSKGMKIIVGHGESPVEPMIPGTNRAALEADIDILAHPGQILDDDVLFAAKRKILLELTSRRGHGTTNSFVAEKALRLGAQLVINTDSHRPEDIIRIDELKEVGIKAGLTVQQVENVFRQTEDFLLRRRK